VSIRVGMRPMARPAMKVPLKLFCVDFRDFTVVDPDGDITVTKSRVAFDTMERTADPYVWKDYGAGHFDEFEHRLDMRLIQPPFYEDSFLDFAEVDPQGDITRTAPRVAFDTMRRSAGAYVYRSYGAGYFTYEEHHIDVRVTSADLRGMGCVWMICNQTGTIGTVYTGGQGAILLRFWRTNAGDYELQLQEFHAGPGASAEVWVCEAGVTYYLVITKSETTGICKIYSDSARTNLLATLTVTLSGTSAGFLRYLQAATSWPNPADADRTITGYAENLTRAADHNAMPTMWMVSNQTGGQLTVYTGQLGSFFIRCRRIPTGEYRIELCEYHAGPGSSQDAWVCEVDVAYYLVITKSGTTGTCKIYSDSARTNLLATLTVTLSGTSAGSFRYLQTASTLPSPVYVDKVMSGYVENLCRVDLPV